MEFTLSNLDLYFRVSYVKLWYGDCPFTAFVEAGPNVLQLDLRPEPGDLDRTITASRQWEFAELFRDRPVRAIIHSHPSGRLENGDRAAKKGTLTVGGDDVTGTYAEIGAVLHKESFEGVGFGLVNGSNSLIPRCCIMIGIDKPSDKVDFKKREGTHGEAVFNIERLAISFEGAQTAQTLKQGVKRSQVPGACRGRRR